MKVSTVKLKHGDRQKKVADMLSSLLPSYKTRNVGLNVRLVGLLYLVLCIKPLMGYAAPTKYKAQNTGAKTIYILF